jgi:cytochrome b subunit of formate dehydrogenase
MTMMVMSMTMMVPPTIVFIIVIAWLAIRIDIARIVIAWLAIRIDIARIVIVIWWWHNDHPRDTDVNIDRCPRRDGTYSDR